MITINKTTVNKAIMKMDQGVVITEGIQTHNGIQRKPGRY
jgi:hypothetical protein